MRHPIGSGRSLVVSEIRSEAERLGRRGAHSEQETVGRLVAALA
jgi:hypothetical protein